jgi:hypothetical protein
MIKLVRLLYVLLFRPFAGPAAIGGGDGKWQDTNPNMSHD